MAGRRSLRLLFLGAPGAGKGTYASKLCKAWKIPHISTGDIIREEISSGSSLGKEFRSYTEKGALVPDELVIRIAEKRLSHPDAQNGYILDGFPRTVAQAEQLKVFSQPSVCLNIRLPDDLLVKKLSGRRVCKDCGANYNVADIRHGEYDMPPLLPKAEDCDKCNGKPALYQREDDSEAVVAQRLQTYKFQTAPLIDYYTKEGVLINFDVKKGIKDLPLVQSLIERTVEAP